MIVTDIETNGLLPEVNTFHCGWIYDYSTGEYTGYRPHEFKEYVQALRDEVDSGGLIAFQNGHMYDVPVVKHLIDIYGLPSWNPPKEHFIDTLVLVRLCYANIKESDAVRLRQGKIKGKYFGSHSLEAWGFRLGILKGEYKDDFKALMEEQGEDYKDGDEWLTFNEPMYDYNEQDVVVTKALFEMVVKNNAYYFPFDCQLKDITKDLWRDTVVKAVNVESDAAWLLSKMVRNGYPTDTKALQELYIVLAGKRSEILTELTKTFGSWYQAKGGKDYFRHPKTGKELPKYPRVIYPKQGEMFLKDGKTLAKTDKFKDAPYTPIEHVTFNPASRDHIFKVLSDAGWVPVEFTEAGNPVVDDEVLEGVHVADPHKMHCIKLIQEYLMLQKRIGQVSEGKNGWLQLVWEDGCMHGSINPNGAVTGRATHSYPNMAQVPAIDKPYGPECRAAFGAGHKGWIQVGTDASGLELRCLGHFMARYDNGEYVQEILTGDIHTKNQHAAGLPTRNNAKTFIYGWLYGAGAAKIGQIVGGDAKAGKALIKSFLESIPAIAALRESLQVALVESAIWVDKKQIVKWKRNFVKGLDGRKIHVRSPHAALNTLLQGAGAVICKQWIIRTEELLIAKGYTHGWAGDFALMAWVHDEMQIACRTQEIADIVGETAQEAMRMVEAEFKFKCQLDTEYKTGRDWKDCH